MLEALPWEALGNVTPWGLVAGCVIAVLTGRLVPANMVNEVRADRDLWRETALTRESALSVALEGVRDMQATTRSMLQILQELRQEAYGDGDEGMRWQSYGEQGGEGGGVADESDPGDGG